MRKSIGPWDLLAVLALILVYLSAVRTYRVHLRPRTAPGPAAPIQAPTRNPHPANVTYSFPMSSNPDLYTVICGGTRHSGAGIKADNHAQYTSVEGEIERP